MKQSITQIFQNVCTFTKKMSVLHIFLSALFVCLWQQLRKLISDFSIFMSIMTFVGLDMLIGLKTPKLIVPTEFKVQKVIFAINEKSNYFKF